MTLFLEAFYGGSHKQLIDLLVEKFERESRLHLKLTMTDKKWHWRARTAAVHYAQEIPQNTVEHFKVLFASSVLNLCELMALRPDLQKLRKILYFHENQLVYPVRKQQDRDFQFGYNQILSCLISGFIKLMPDYRPKDLRQKIEPKCGVLYFPMTFPDIPRHPPAELNEVLRIVWPHRWEHDKQPEPFFRVLLKLSENGLDFRLSVLNDCYDEKPAIFNEAKAKLSSKIDYWGSVSKSDYFSVLAKSDVVVSTAIHESFGVSMLEATYLGCYPLCPNRLVYPEIYPSECLYNTEDQLFKRLKQYCAKPDSVRQSRKEFNLDFDKYSWTTLEKSYEDLLTIAYNGNDSRKTTPETAEFIMGLDEIP